MMGPFRIRTAALFGIEGVPLVVEASPADSFRLDPRLPQGARLRIKAAIQNSGWELPRASVAILARGDDVQQARLDLPIALAALAAMGILPPAKTYSPVCIGELGLDGSLRGVRGALPLVLTGARDGATAAILAWSEATPTFAALSPIPVWLAHDLRGAAACFHEGRRCSLVDAAAPPLPPEPLLDADPAFVSVLAALASGRNVLLVGPPGSGKTLLARKLPSRLPLLSAPEQRDVAVIQSAAGLGVHRCTEPPFRAPHHTVSTVGLIGGGDPARPGELSLAHHGVLFLDELSEFRRDAIERLGAALHVGHVVVTRRGRTTRLPAAVHVVAAANPCPCGFGEKGSRPCQCTATGIARYRQRLEEHMGNLRPYQTIELLAQRP